MGPEKTHRLTPELAAAGGTGHRARSLPHPCAQGFFVLWIKLSSWRRQNRDLKAGT